MTSAKLSRAVEQLGRAAPPRAGDGPGDAALLQAFIDRREEAAFAALVRRHGPMVLGVCRRVLNNAHDAEDAFQAAFLVLARRADRVTPRDRVGNWLYGVAYRTALHARSAVTRRRAREMPADVAPEPAAEVAPDRAAEWIPLLDQELARLPDKYRAAVVLCELEGRSREDAARELGIPEGTLSSRLAAARKRLADRFRRRGLVLPAGALAGILSQTSVSASCASAVSRAAVAGGAGEAVAAGLISAEAAALTTGVMKAMFLTKLKVMTAVLVAAGLALGGAGVVGGSALADAPKPAGKGDGAKPAAGPKDGAKPAGPRDGEKPAAGPKDGEKPKVGPKDGDKPANPAGGKGEPVTITGTISKDDLQRKRDDGSTVAVTTFFLTEAGGNKVTLPGPRVNEAGKVLDSFSLASVVGKTVTVTGRGYTAATADGSTAKRVVRVIGITEVKEVSAKP